VRFFLISLITVVVFVFMESGFCNEKFKNDHPIFEGEIIVEMVTHSSGMPGLRASFIVTASRETIWDVLTDYTNYRKIFDGIDKMAVIEQDDKGATLEFWIDAVVIELHYVLRRKYVIEGEELSWKRLSGDLEEITGRWLIQNTNKNNVYIIVFESYVDVGNFIITSIARFIAVRKAKSMAQKLRSWIESSQILMIQRRKSLRHLE
jgi:ribosome-associated toxin RatA of RatAB toxin-antitoxin module